MTATELQILLICSLLSVLCGIAIGAYYTERYWRKELKRICKAHEARRHREVAEAFNLGAKLPRLKVYTIGGE